MDDQSGVFRLQKEIVGTSAMVTFVGELDLEYADDTQAAVEDLLQDPAVLHLIVDATDLDYLDSSGLRVLLAARQILASRGGRVQLNHAKPTVRSVIGAAGLDGLL
jgi:anti-anti-sigma factor